MFRLNLNVWLVITQIRQTVHSNIKDYVICCEVTFTTASYIHHYHNVVIMKYSHRKLNHSALVTAIPTLTFINSIDQK